MEELNNTESFESFRSRITEIFKREGLSENLEREIDIWHKRKQEETDRPGGTIEQRVVFQMELAQIYLVMERNDFAFDTLSDAWDQANNKGLSNLVKEITDLMNSIL